MVKNYVTHAIQLKLHEWMNKQQIVTSYGENKNLNEEIKKNRAGQVLTYNSKNFHWLNKKLDLERTMSESGKSFRKKN